MKDLSRVSPIIKDLLELDRIAEKALESDKKKEERKNGREQNQRLPELEKTLMKLRKLIAEMIAVLTAKPKDGAEAKQLKEKFKFLAKETMALLEGLAKLLSGGHDKESRELDCFLALKLARYRTGRAA